MRVFMRMGATVTLEAEERFDMDLRTGPANIWYVAVNPSGDPSVATVRGTMIKRDGSHGVLNREDRVLLEHLPEHVRVALCLAFQNQLKEWSEKDWTAVFALTPSQT